jgi:predicted PurR-regulated permease PerM
MPRRGDTVDQRTRGDEGIFRVRGWLVHSAGWSWRFLVIVAALAVLFFVLNLLRSLFLAMFLALIMASILGPIVEWLRRHRVPGPLGAVVVVLGSAFLIAAIVFGVLRGLVTDLPDVGRALEEASAEIEGWLAGRPLDVGKDIATGLVDGLKSLVTNAAKFVGASLIQGVSFLTSLISTVVLALFLTLFSLADWRRVWGWLVSKASEKDRARVDSAGRRVLSTIGAWVFAQTVTAAIDGLGIGIGLIALDIPFVLPLILLTVLFAYIPIFGAIISGAVVVLVALATRGADTALLALLVVLVVQQIEANVLSPFIVSKAVRFHPLATMILTAVAAALFGVMGMFVIVPLAGSFVAANEELRPSGPSPEPRPRATPTGAGKRSDAAD